MKKTIPTILIAALVILLGINVFKSGVLKSPVQDELTEYIENSENPEAGEKIEKMAEIVKEAAGMIASGSDETTTAKYSGTKDQAEEKMVTVKPIKTIALEEVELIYVIDGDTLLVLGEDSKQYKVRLIGIDTPESVNADESKNTVYGEMASDHTKALLKDVDTLYLEYDEQTVDIYGRVLAYVWLKSNTSDINDMVNAKILYDGYAVDKVYEPNERYKKEFKTLRDDAEEKERGLWANIGYHDMIYGE